MGHDHQKLLHLPEALMAQARRLYDAAPRQAATLALRAIAVEVLTRLPLRLDNLRGLRLDLHLRRQDPACGLISHISIPAHEVKNNRPVLLPVSGETARRLEEWIRCFRPAIALPGCLHLFPGGRDASEAMTPQGLRSAVKAVTEEYVGVTLSPHQFRHLAAHTYLRAFPGQYEAVRQLLGHASITTTVRHYSGTECEAAARRFDEVILATRHGGRRPPGGGGTSSRVKAGSKPKGR